MFVSAGVGIAVNLYIGFGLNKEKENLNAKAATAIYNLVGLSLAAFGILPPIVAAVAQSLPDLGILANSARLLRQPHHPAQPDNGKARAR